MEISVFNKEGKEKEKFDLPDDLLGGGFNKDVLYQAIIKYQSSLRQGTSSTKTRGEVSGGGKKPWRQKGTGRARQGSIRSPLWVKGGVVFGPHPRNYSYSIPKKIKRAALRESLKVKLNDKNLFCVEDISDPLNKTKEFIKILSSLKLQGKTLGILDGSHGNIFRISRNIARFTLKSSHEVTANDILRNKNLLVSKTALGHLLDGI